MRDLADMKDVVVEAGALNQDVSVMFFKFKPDAKDNPFIGSGALAGGFVSVIQTCWNMRKRLGFKAVR